MMDGENLVGGEEDQVGGAVLIRIHVPDLNIHKCLQFYRQDLVWDVKQQCLASLPKELKESFNYGLFAPPCNGKAGKFLDEERPLTDYPFSGPVGYLELRYKRRLYKGLSVDEKQLKSLHTKSNLKRFVDYVSSGHCEKVIKMCAKGLDPNFHCSESGETPLSMAAVMKKPSKLLIALVNGGALLDYRTKEGATAMHRAVESKSLEAVKTLLDLGGSPNYKDAKGLTPLYLSVAANADPALCEALLHDHAFLGAQDLQGWNETHQACRNGLIHHLEHLLYYGADMNAKNASGNTPLHVCAVNNQESCVRLLLFRGADKEALNYANQTPYQVAVIAGNMELAEIIQNHRTQDVVPYRDLPKYNPKRRVVISRALCDPRLNCSMTCLSGRISRGPPSPCPSNRSLPPFSSASSSMSTHSESYSESSYSGGSSHFGSEDNCGSAITDKSLDHSDITSDSSGVGTCNSGGSGSSYDATPTDPALILPGMMVVCVENYAAQSPRHLKLTEGDIIEVTASTDTGFLEGSLKGQIGLFPLSCVQEIRMKSYESRNHLLPPSRTQGRKETPTSSKQCAKSPRIKKIWGEPHTVILHRGQKGFGFILRGAKSDSPLMELQASDRFPALQYLDDVDVNGVADRAGLRKGDFVLSINSVDVTMSSHEAVVDLIRKSGELVSLTVLGLSLPSNVEQESSKPGSPASLTCDQTSGGTPKAQYHFATLPRKFSGSNGPSVPSPPRRDPTTSLSVGRARAKSMVAALADLGISSNIGQECGVGTKSNSVDSIAGKPPLPPASSLNGGHQLKTASIRARPTSSRITATEIQEIFIEKAMNGDINGSCSPAENAHKIYASVSEMKRSKSGLKAKELVTLHKDFHSTPDLKEFVKQTSNDGTKTIPGVPQEIKSLSQESLHKLKTNPRHSWACLSSTPQGFLERNYENSWKSIQKIPAFEEKKDSQAQTMPAIVTGVGDDGDAGVESDGGSSESSSSESSGDETPTAAVKTQVLTESEYRTSKPLRPIQSKTLPRRASTGCATIGPAEQQTIINLVPPGQVIKVDVSKSTEYASLDIASTMLSRRDSNSSSVMSSFKPTDSAKLYASPDDLKSIGYRETSGGESNNVGTTGTLKKARSHSVPRGSESSGSGRGRDYARPDLTAGKGQALTNGPIRKTEEVIRGAKNDERLVVEQNLEKEDGQFDPQKSLQEAKERLKPVLKGNLVNNINNQSAAKIRIEVKQSPRLARKAEKTVTFQAEIPPITCAASQGSTGQMSHSLSVDEFQKVKSSLKSSKSFPNDLGLDDGDGNSSSGVSSDGGAENTATMLQAIPQSTFSNNYVTCLPINPDSDSSEDSSDKTWILKEENGGINKVIDEGSRNSHNLTGVSTANTGGPSLLKKQPMEIKSLPGAAQGQEAHDQHSFTINPVTTASSTGQTQSSIFLSHKAPEQGMPAPVSVHNNSSTLGRIPNTRPPQSGGNLTKNAVSLVKLPPPMELESESEDKSPRETPTPKPPQLNSNPMYHTLQPQRSRPMIPETQQIQTTAVRQLQYQGQVQGPTRQAEKSIEESLQLIRMHVAALKEFPSASPSPIDFGAKSQTPILAPPPEFSDARDTHESCTRFNQGLLNMAASANESQQPFNRHSPLYRSISHTHSSSSSNYSGYPTMTRQQYQLQQQQQNIQMQQQHQYQQLAQHGQLAQNHTLGQQPHPLGQQTHPLAQQHPLGQQQLQLTPQQQYQMAQQRQAGGQPVQQLQHQMNQQVMSSSMPAYHTLGRTPSYSTSTAQTMLNKSGYGHYQTLTSVKQQQQSQQHSQQQQQQSQQHSQQQQSQQHSQQQQSQQHLQQQSQQHSQQQQSQQHAQQQQSQQHSQQQQSQQQSQQQQSQQHSQQQQSQQHSQQQQPPQQPTPLQNAQAQSATSLFQQQHHPKCYYYQQTPSSTGGNGKYIPEKLHPVHRYTPDICENGPRIVGTIPKKQPGTVDHYEVPHAHQLLLQQQQQQQQQQQGQQGARVRREFRNKTLPEWSVADACDWLDSLFMPEYKIIFQQKTIDGKKLIRMDNATLLELGVKKLGHRMNLEKSLKRYMPQPKT